MSCDRSCFNLLLFLSTVCITKTCVMCFNPLESPKRVSADPDQTPRNAASDQGLRYLQIVKVFFLLQKYLNIIAGRTYN